MGKDAAIMIAITSIHHYVYSLIDRLLSFNELHGPNEVNTRNLKLILCIYQERN